MELAFQELPLAIFTTLAPMGAGVFIGLAILFAKGDLSDERAAKLYKLTLIPILFLVVGFAAAFIHLANPFHAVWALSGIGHSPLTNEITAGVIFTVIAIIFWILGITGKLKKKQAGTFLTVIAVLALVFALFTGMAYWVDTISTWATPALLIEMLGVCIAGGMTVTEILIAASDPSSDGAGEPLPLAARKMLVICMAVGLVLVVVGAAWQYGLSAVTLTPFSDGGQMASQAAVVFAIGLVLVVVAAGFACYSLLKRLTMSNAVWTVVLMVIGVFMVRLVFYALRISVGI